MLKKENGKWTSLNGAFKMDEFIGVPVFATEIDDTDCCLTQRGTVFNPTKHYVTEYDEYANVHEMQRLDVLPMRDKQGNLTYVYRFMEDGFNKIVGLINVHPCCCKIVIDDECFQEISKYDFADFKANGNSDHILQKIYGCRALTDEEYQNNIEPQDIVESDNRLNAIIDPIKKMVEEQNKEQEMLNQLLSGVSVSCPGSSQSAAPQQTIAEDEYPDRVLVEVVNPLEHTFCAHVGYLAGTFDSGDAYISPDESFVIDGAPDNARVIEMDGKQFAVCYAGACAKFDPQTMTVKNTFKMKDKAVLEQLFGQELTDDCVAMISSHQLRVCPLDTDEDYETEGVFVYVDHDGLPFGDGYVPDFYIPYMADVFEELFGEDECMESCYECDEETYDMVKKINTLNLEE